jgi:hypothetical protein
MIRPVKILLSLLALSFVPAALAKEATIKSKIVDAATNSVTEIVSDSKGKIIKKTVFYFDVNNWTTGAVHYDTSGKVKYKESYKRNAAGQMTESYLYSPEDKLLGHRTFAYSGKSVQIDDYDAAGRLIPKANPPAATTGKKKR